MRSDLSMFRRLVFGSSRWPRWRSWLRFPFVDLSARYLWQDEAATAVLAQRLFNTGNRWDTMAAI